MRQNIKDQNELKVHDETDNRKKIRKHKQIQTNKNNNQNRDQITQNNT